MISPIKKTHPPPLLPPPVAAQVPTQSNTMTGGYTDAHPTDEEMFKRRYVAIQDIINELEDENNLIAHRIAKIRKRKIEAEEIALQRQAKLEKAQVKLAAEEKEREWRMRNQAKDEEEDGIPGEGNEIGQIVDREEQRERVEEEREGGGQEKEEGGEMEVDFDDQLNRARGSSTHLSPNTNRQTNPSISPLLNPPSPSRHTHSSEISRHRESEEDVEMDDY